MAMKGKWNISKQSEPQKDEATNGNITDRIGKKNIKDFVGTGNIISWS